MATGTYVPTTKEVRFEPSLCGVIEAAKEISKKKAKIELDLKAALLKGDNQSIRVDDAVALLGESCVDVRLNGAAYWCAIPINVWNYTLGGYQVLKKWLSYREFALLGRSLNSEEAGYFAQVVRRISSILLLGPALDASYALITPTALGFPTQESSVIVQSTLL